MPRIYPSNQDTNLTAIGSLIFSYYDILPTNSTDYIQVFVNGILRDRDYDLTEGLYSTYLYIGDVVTIEMFTEEIFFKNITIYRRDYTTDDTNDFGIIDTYISQYNNNTQTISLTFTATTLNSGYNFEYRVSGNVGTNPENDCQINGIVINRDGDYVLVANPDLYLSKNGGQTFNELLSSVDIQSIAINYYGDKIGYTQFGDGVNLGGIFYSQDGGDNFYPSTASYVEMPNYGWGNMDCNYDGNYFVVPKISGSMYYSTNSGQTYNTISGSAKMWSKAVIKDNNLFPFYAITSNDDDYIYKFNSSSSFTTLSANSKPPSSGSFKTNFNDFAISQDGTYVAAAYEYADYLTGSLPRSIMVSSDSGTTYTFRNVGFEVYQPIVNMSNDGKYIQVATRKDQNEYGNLSYSQDFGNTWVTCSLVLDTPVTIDSSGTGENIYMGMSYPLNLSSRLFKIPDYGGCITSSLSYIFNGQVVKVNKS